VRDCPEYGVTFPTTDYAGRTAERNGVDDPGASPLHREPSGKLGPSAEKPTSATRPASLAGIVLDTLELEPEAVEAAAAAALRNKTDLATELVASNATDASTLAAAMAAALDLPFEDFGAGDRIIDVDRMLGKQLPRLIKACDERLETKLFLRPTFESLDPAAAHLAEWPELKAIARVTTAPEAAAAIDRQTAESRRAAAVLSLSAEHPRLSARTVLAPGQAALLVLSLWLGSSAFHHAPGLSLAIFHAAVAVLFASCLIFRLATIIGTESPADAQDMPFGEEPLPLYSVLVALHHETAVVPRLIAALSRLDWPASRIEIKLVCEADDKPTIRTVQRAIQGRPQFAVVLVPPSEPRTKPKALNYALPLTSGEFVVLYDAEDEPDPGQLREAYERFRTGPAKLACLQAPLVVRNGERNWLAGLFALEYAALFRRLLPWLARHDLPLPLGGTSNHFVRAHLVAVGAWDSHNVTEDADLGLRLFRGGYRIGTIGKPTFEDAPERWDVWYKQRTRWMKGWIQTYLLHMREPRRLMSELGLKRMAAFQLLFLGMLASCLVHPVFLMILAVFVGRLLTGAVTIAECGPLIALDLFNAAGGYSVFIILSTGVLDRHERQVLPKFYLALPLYWVMVAIAGLRAFFQLFFIPHKWEKTPHGLESRADPGDVRYRLEPCFDGSHPGWM